MPSAKTGSITHRTAAACLGSPASNPCSWPSARYTEKALPGWSSSRSGATSQSPSRRESLAPSNCSWLPPCIPQPTFPHGSASPTPSPASPHPAKTVRAHALEGTMAATGVLTHGAACAKGDCCCAVRQELCTGATAKRSSAFRGRAPSTMRLPRMPPAALVISSRSAMHDTSCSAHAIRGPNGSGSRCHGSLRVASQTAGVEGGSGGGEGGRGGEGGAGGGDGGEGSAGGGNGGSGAGGGAGGGMHNIAPVTLHVLRPPETHSRTSPYLPS